MFDSIYPDRVREVSGHFWTPVAVARRVAVLLAELGASRVLDVGSGPGKFCLAAAAARPTLELTGVEQRASLVAVARAAASQLGLDHVEFVQGAASDVDWDRFDGFYFYNPFGENLFSAEERPFDQAVELSNERYLRDVALTERRLTALAAGSVVATYHGFGGAIPGSFVLAHEERCATGWIRIWAKRAGDGGCESCWHELHGGGVKRGHCFDSTLVERLLHSLEPITVEAEVPLDAASRRGTPER